jgi:hypothetical protein
VLAGALATAVLALVVAIPRLTVTPDDTRIKGTVDGRPALAVYRRTPAGSERLADGDVARAGDLLRVGYASGGRAYGVILSIDGTGAVTLHLPPSGVLRGTARAGGITCSTRRTSSTRRLESSGSTSSPAARPSRSRRCSRSRAMPRRARCAVPAGRTRTGNIRGSERGTQMTAAFPILLSAFLSGADAQPARAAVPLQRFLLVVGANAGGGDRAKLQYAISDAERFARVMVELGGVLPANEVVLKQPRVKDLIDALDTLNARVTSARRAPNPGRVEVVVYYSGHADDQGLLLGVDRYPYRMLRDRLDAIPADVRIAVLDACASGAFTRLKGGRLRRRSSWTNRPPCAVTRSSPPAPRPKRRRSPIGFARRTSRTT